MRSQGGFGQGQRCEVGEGSLPRVAAARRCGSKPQRRHLKGRNRSSSASWSAQALHQSPAQRLSHRRHRVGKRSCSQRPRAAPRPDNGARRGGPGWGDADAPPKHGWPRILKNDFILRTFFLDFLQGWLDLEVRAEPGTLKSRNLAGFVSVSDRNATWVSILKTFGFTLLPLHALSVGHDGNRIDGEQAFRTATQATTGPRNGSLLSLGCSVRKDARAHAVGPAKAPVHPGAG